MPSLRRAVIVFLGIAMASASVALLATVTAPKKSGTIWPLHSHNLAAETGMLMAWIFLGLALILVLVWLADGEGDQPKDDPYWHP